MVLLPLIRSKVDVPIIAAGGIADPTGRGLELPDRPIVTHHFTGVDVPLLSDEELRSRLGDDRPDTNADGVDEFGIPNSLSQRRRDLLEASYLGEKAL